ncbi:hypothetical protein LAUMK191_05451 [Mycobacterium attenuatum]|uniref:MEDS domain-containing protein n=1 Tax=Mycobacterium attenuatum TaxID=2341086 RepID=UPI000F03BAA3|nr:MEDS domain-containing protein [Mycobacterium attenuatum]VBA60300.1 hypothetical protein LAUMK191_05451 [Mycobacterium attenuatum]
MRPHGVVASAAGLVPFGHLGWGYRARAQFLTRAAEYLLDGRRLNQWVDYVGAGSRDQLRAELAAMPTIADLLDSGGIGVTPVTEFYTFRPGSDVVDPERAVAQRVEAVGKALADGYSGLRAIVDCTAVARTPAQRDAFACFEFLIDQQMAVLPVSALCAYDTSRLREGAGELMCLHPYVGQHAPGFRLYAAPGSSFALTGEIDAASEPTFAAALHRTWPLTGDDTLVIDARELSFISHRQLDILDRCARSDNRIVVLRTDQPVPARLFSVLDFTNVRLEVPTDDPGDRVSKPGRGSAGLAQVEQHTPAKPAIEQVKGVLMYGFGWSAQEAFDALVTLSQDTNTKLRDVAAQLLSQLTGPASQQSRRGIHEAITTVRDRLRGDQTPVDGARGDSGGRQP